MTSTIVGVCSWCIDRHDVLRAIRVAGSELQLQAVQVGFFTADALRSADAGVIAEAASNAGVALTGTFLAFEGEDYSSIGRIAETGGYGLDDVFEQRLSLTREAAGLTAELGCTALAVHAGTIPTDRAHPMYGKLIDRVGLAADAAGEAGVRLSLETGREPVDTLLSFMDALSRANIGVNFDPGNLILYGMDEPAPALTFLAGRIDNVHLKDARRSAQPGVLFGQTAPLGTGDAQIPRVVSKLRTINYPGPMLIEVPARAGNLQPIRDAATYVRSLVG